ncbi:MAG TPA: FtsQ-type POTRA domain-containing protein [Kiritimatiellia bacterium]|nr:FtsQ-type POTRA domain-containing protein [Kiritimatiellia bacterium]HMP34877.1 FtsQ-type POTRA domain-containing protein [Kiritimatiellia bacterium]
MLFSSKKKEQQNRYNRRKTLPRAPVYTMHAKAAEQRNESMHKVGAILLALVALGGAIWVAVAGAERIRAWLFVENDQFLIETISIASTGTLSPDHIREFGGITEGQNLFAVDIKGVRARLEAGPLIKKAEVTRQLPGTLEVRVQERIPLARIPQAQAGFFFAVDVDGKVLGLAGRKHGAMPMVKGFKDRGLAPGDFLRDGGAIDALQVIGLCDGTMLGQVIQISAIDVGHPDYLELSLANGVKVLLPRNPPRSKLEDLVVYLRESGGRLNFIDLTLDRNVPAS